MISDLMNAKIQPWIATICFIFFVHSVGASEICLELKKTSNLPIQLVFGNKLTKNINLGDLEAGLHVLHPAHMGVFVDKKYSDTQGDCPRSCVSLQSKPSQCKGWNYFEGKISIEPAVFGAGNFEHDFTLKTSKPDKNDEGIVTLDFTVTGIFHGGWLGIDAEKKDVEDWLYGRKNSLTITINNSGDRDIRIGNMEITLTAVSVNNVITSNLTNDKCSRNILKANQKCTFTAVSETASLVSSSKVMYLIYFSNDAIGSGNAQIFIERDSDARISFSTGYAN